VKQLVEDGLHPQVIIRGLRKACKLAIGHISTLSVTFGDDPEESKNESAPSLRFDFFDFL